MSTLRRLVPAPLTSVALLVAWLLLARTPGIADILLGLVLALAIPHAFSGLRIGDARVRRPLLAMRYVARVCMDVVASNLQVARGTLRAGSPKEPPRITQSASASRSTELLGL